MEATDFDQKMQRIEELVRQIENIADPNTRAGAVELLQALMDLHGAGMQRMLQLVESQDGNKTIVQSFGEDDLVSSLLLLYGLHPLDLETRVSQALDKVGPHLASHGGKVVLKEISAEGVVRLELQGSCNCNSSSAQIRQVIENAVYEKAPDLTALEVKDSADQSPSSELIVLET